MLWGQSVEIYVETFLLIKIQNDSSILLLNLPCSNSWIKISARCTDIANEVKRCAVSYLRWKWMSISWVVTCDVHYNIDVCFISSARTHFCSWHRMGLSDRLKWSYTRNLVKFPCGMENLIEKDVHDNFALCPLCYIKFLHIATIMH